MNKRHLYFLCGFLVLVGVGVTAYRAIVLEFPLFPREITETWRVEARLEFEATGEPVRATLSLPESVPGLTIFDEAFVSPGYGIVTNASNDARVAIFTKRAAEGPQVIYYRAIVHKARSREGPAKAPEPQMQRSRYAGAELAAARSLIDNVYGRSADDESFVRLLFEELDRPARGGPAAFLLGENRTKERTMTTAVRVLAEARIPARVVHGLPLVPDSRKATPDHWIEIYEDDTWRSFDPATLDFRVPSNRLPWWRTAPEAVQVVGGETVSVNFAVRRMFVDTLQSALAKSRQSASRLIEFSVFGLPLQTQEVYRLLLTVPIGIFLLVVLRNVIGVRTFGTFMPVLIALAFRQTELLWGAILFATVLSIGLLVRFYLEQLKLLLVPRLASVVIVVVLIMVLISVISHKLGFERGLSVALFPIVILSMTIERMTVVWDERGPREAFIQATGSFIVAALCYYVMNFDYLRHFVFVFPESLLIVLAATLMLGRYAGYRLVELFRFKVLAGER